MIITEEQFDLTIERAFTRGMEFQKKNQKELEKVWFDIGYNAGVKFARLNQGEYDALQQD
jgi:hypothetical protein